MFNTHINKHQITMQNKLRFIWVIPLLLLTISGSAKVLQLDFMVANMTEAGMNHMILGVGIIELLCVIVFLVPKTRTIGFLLCTAYCGGIIAAEWAAGQVPIPGIAVTALLWIGMFFEKKAFFEIG
ncbi:MAG: DoxX family protein [Bacteroidota bacterium]